MKRSAVVLGIVIAATIATDPCAAERCLASDAFQPAWLKLLVAGVDLALVVAATALVAADRRRAATWCVALDFGWAVSVGMAVHADLVQLALGGDAFGRVVLGLYLGTLVSRAAMIALANDVRPPTEVAA